MLSLFNKSSGKNEVSPSLAWRPNFRNTATLPDIKTVRTKFFVNVVGIAAVLVLVLLVSFREVKLGIINGEIAEVEKRIGTVEKSSQKAVADFKLFQIQEKRFNESYELVKNSFSFPDFILHLGSILPKGVKLRRADFRGAGQSINISGSVKGVDAAASDVASEFLKLLRNDPIVSKYFGSVTMPTLGRNVGEGSMNFELVFNFVESGRKGGK